jgi:CBS domain-containing protein
MKLQEFLNGEVRGFFSLDASQTAEDAIRLMTKKQVGCVLVTEDDQPVGIFTERDVLHCYVRCQEKPYNEIPLKQAMTNKLIVGRPEDDLEQTISLMVQADIRHLPIVEGQNVVDVIYICDLLHHQMGTLNTEIRYLEEYLKDLQSAVTD